MLPKRVRANIKKGMYPLVLIEVPDHASMDGHRSVYTPICYTTGWIYKETPEAYYVCNWISDKVKDDCSGFHVVVKCKGL